MSGMAEFDEYVTARSRHLLRIAYLLTGDHALAEDLLQTALAKSWAVWGRICGDPEPYVRKVLLNTYNSWWRRHWRGERPTGTLPERSAPAPQAAVDDRDQVWRALSRLPRQQRLVLVLRYFEDLSEAEIAQTLGISPGTVKAHASRALAALRLDPSLRALPLPTGDDVPAGNERLAAVRGRIAQRRRNRLAVLAAACAVVLAGIAGYAVAPWPRGQAHPAGLPLAEAPDVYDGHRIVGRISVPLRQHSASFTWTPSTLDVKFYVECAHDTPGVAVAVLVLIDGQGQFDAACGETAALPVTGIDPPMARLAAAGVTVGRPVTVTVTVLETRSVSYPSHPPHPSGSPADGPTPGVTGRDEPPLDGHLTVLLGERLP